jgi:hypothetical protein
MWQILWHFFKISFHLHEFYQHAPCYQHLMASQWRRLCFVIDWERVIHKILNIQPGIIWLTWNPQLYVMLRAYKQKCIITNRVTDFVLRQSDAPVSLFRDDESGMLNQALIYMKGYVKPFFIGHSDYWLMRWRVPSSEILCRIIWREFSDVLGKGAATVRQR